MAQHLKTETVANGGIVTGEDVSADNGIYILETPADPTPEFRVTHAQAIENVWWNPETKEIDQSYWNEDEILAYFSKCKVYRNRLEALEVAHKMAEDYTVLEYGVSSLRCPIKFPKRQSCGDAC